MVKILDINYPPDTHNLSVTCKSLALKHQDVLQIFVDFQQEYINQLKITVDSNNKAEKIIIRN